jgi:serine/threonine protein kinase
VGVRGRVQHFENLDQIGEGTYGQVFMAKDKTTGEIVALKKVSRGWQRWDRGGGG